MAYKIREGVILRQVCGEWLIIAAGDAANHCTYVRQVNETLAFYWKLLAEGCTSEQMVSRATEKFEVTENQAKEDVNQLINQLIHMKYLITDNETEKLLRQEKKSTIDSVGEKP